MKWTCLAVGAVWLLALGPGSPARADLRFGGFTDYSYFATDADSGPSSGIREGQFVLHLNSALSDRLAFFGEITWSPSDHGFGTEIERSILTYRHNDAFKPSVGRYHTPVSWWNVAFHHGAWLQTSVDRPIPVKFGSSFTPVHFVGAMVDGTVFPAGLNVSYTGGVGNGRGENVARAGDAGDVNEHRATIVRLQLRPDALYSLQAGGALYLDRFPIEADGSELDETMLSAFVVYTSETPELLAEFFFIRHEDDVTGQTSESTSYYVQLGYRLPWRHGLCKPYGRVENMDISDTDRGFMEAESAVPDLRRYLAGIRLDVAAPVAVKLEGRRSRERNFDWVNEFFTSVSLVF